MPNVVKQNEAVSSYPELTHDEKEDIFQYFKDKAKTKAYALAVLKALNKLHDEAWDRLANDDGTWNMEQAEKLDKTAKKIFFWQELIDEHFNKW